MGLGNTKRITNVLIGNLDQFLKHDGPIITHYLTLAGHSSIYAMQVPMYVVDE